MNIFYLDRDPVKAAEYAVDRHVVKMIQETAQLLSTAHRVIDGAWHKQVLNPTVYRNLSTLGWSGRVDCTARLLPGESIVFDTTDSVRDWVLVNKQAMKMTHVNHPSAIWARSSVENYMWLYNYLDALSAEKLHRYPKGPNSTWRDYGRFLSNVPANLTSVGFTDPPLAMPAEYKTDDAVEAYRRYYIGDKYHFAKWTNRKIPSWFLSSLADVWATDPEKRVKLISDPKIAKRTEISMNHVKKYLPDVYNQLKV